MTRRGSSPIPGLVIVVLILSGCLGRRPPNDDIPPRPTSANFPALPADPGLRVLVLGDMGTGKEGQQEVADAIAATHAQAPPDFVLTVGDNFYPAGVQGPGDPLWKSHFESVYQGPFWEGLVFYPSLGNHDYHGRPEAQIEYSRLSSRWHLPDRYHAFRHPLPGRGSATFLALDTNPAADGGDTWEAQRIWADSILTEEAGSWLIAYGHHPLLSGGWHGPDQSLRKALLPLFTGRVPLYLAGHNHTTELLATGAGTLQAVCGGGGGLDNPYRVEALPGTLAAFTNGGWCFLHIWPEVLAVELYDRGGGLQFRHLVGR